MAVVVPFRRGPARRSPDGCGPLTPDAAMRLPRHRAPLPAWIVSAVARYARRRAAIRTLRCLDDRLLRDIGIERKDIVATVDALLANGTVMRGCVLACLVKTSAER